LRDTVLQSSTHETEIRPQHLEFSRMANSREFLGC
jgi:hypothetical protein